MGVRGAQPPSEHGHAEAFRVVRSSRGGEREEGHRRATLGDGLIGPTASMPAFVEGARTTSMRRVPSWIAAVTVEHAPRSRGGGRCAANEPSERRRGQRTELARGRDPSRPTRSLPIPRLEAVPASPTRNRARPWSSTTIVVGPAGRPPRGNWVGEHDRGFRPAREIVQASARGRCGCGGVEAGGRLVGRGTAPPEAADEAGRARSSRRRIPPENVP